MKSIRSLLSAFGEFKAKEFFRADFWLSIVVGLAVLCWIFTGKAGYDGIAPYLINVVGVIIGGVVAALAVQVAFIDTPFLRKILAIKRHPLRYLLPFLFTVSIGVVSEISLILYVVISGAHQLAAMLLGLLSAFLSSWTIVSLILCLDALVQFVNLKVDAARLGDDMELPSDEEE